jgi:hypothetical protein
LNWELCVWWYGRKEHSFYSCENKNQWEKVDLDLNLFLLSIMYNMNFKINCIERGTKSWEEIGINADICWNTFWCFSKNSQLSVSFNFFYTSPNSFSITKSQFFALFFGSSGFRRPLWVFFFQFIVRERVRYVNIYRPNNISQLNNQNYNSVKIQKIFRTFSYDDNIWIEKNIK